MGKKKQYWFRAKHYGWGWGLPITWQGWAVWGAFLVAVIVGAFWFLSRNDATGFGIYCTVSVLALVLICTAKGEPLH